MMPSVALTMHRQHAALVEFLEANRGAVLLPLGWFSNTDICITADPDDIRHVMQTNAEGYIKGDHWRQRLDVFGKSYFNMDSDHTRLQRIGVRSFLAHPQFHRLLGETFRGSVSRLATTLKDASERGGAIDLKDCLQKQMFHTTCGAFAGCELLGRSHEKRFFKAISDSFEAIMFRYVLPPWFWRTLKRLGMWKERNLSEAWDTLNEIAADLISEKRRQIRNGAYMTRHKFFESFPKEESALRENFYSVLFAAEDTTTTTLIWFFWLLGNHPSVEAKIVQELKMCWPKSGTSVLEFSAEELRKMVYLHATLCETLRLYPPVAFESRIALRADTLPSGYRIGGRTKQVALAMYAIGRMKRVWGEDCQEFKRERWITIEGGIKYEPPHKFFAFNAGQRMCPGKDIAFNLMKAAIGNILYNYRVKIEPDQPVSLKNNILHKMNNSLMARIEKRS